MWRFTRQNRVLWLPNRRCPWNGPLISSRRSAYIVILIKRVKVRNFTTSALNFNICLLLIGVKNRSHYTHLTRGNWILSLTLRSQHGWTLMDPICCHNATRSIPECSGVLETHDNSIWFRPRQFCRKSRVKEACSSWNTSRQESIRCTQQMVEHLSTAEYM